jgi:hypothetical protein
MNLLKKNRKLQEKKAEKKRRSSSASSGRIEKINTNYNNDRNNCKPEQYTSSQLEDLNIFIPLKLNEINTLNNKNEENPYPKIIRNQTVEEKRIHSIFNGICPKCKTKSDGMNVGNARECLMCNVVYDLNDKFKEYTKDEWIIKNKRPPTKEEQRREDILNEICPYCKVKLVEIWQGRIRKCSKCIKVFDILNNFGEYSEEEFRRNCFSKEECPNCKKKMYKSTIYPTFECLKCSSIYERNNNFKEYSNQDWEKEKERKKKEEKEKESKRK